MGDNTHPRGLSFSSPEWSVLFPSSWGSNDTGLSQNRELLLIVCTEPPRPPTGLDLCLVRSALREVASDSVRVLKERQRCFPEEKILTEQTVALGDGRELSDETAGDRGVRSSRSEFLEDIIEETVRGENAPYL